jgi:hypothetical protein
VLRREDATLRAFWELVIEDTYVLLTERVNQLGKDLVADHCLSKLI